MMLPLVFAACPLLLSGIALVWLFRLRYTTFPEWGMRVLACGSLFAFAFLAGPWAFTSYYLRYALLAFFALAVALSYFRTRSDSPRHPARDKRITVTALAVFLVFAVLDALVIASYSVPGKTLDIPLPFGPGTYYVLQGGTSVVTNPFHTLGGSPQALDIVRLNRFGNRADGLAPRALRAYAIFGERLYSPCRGTVASRRDGLPDNAPGNPDTGHPEGNHIVLGCAGGDILMAHLRQGSVSVTPGDTVAPGRVLAQIGNSGNSLEPHLHLEASRDGERLGLTINGRSLSINSLVRQTSTGTDPD